MFVDVELVFGIVELMFNVAEHKIYRGMWTILGGLTILVDYF